MKNKELARSIGIVAFVLFSGMLVTAFHSAGSQTFSREIDGSSLDIQKIKNEMESMDRDEIERTIEQIEKEIERLNSEIR